MIRGALRRAAPALWLAACGASPQAPDDDEPIADAAPRPDAARDRTPEAASDTAEPRIDSAPASDGPPADGPAKTVDAAPAVGCRAPEDRSAPAPRLSQTGCVDSADPRKPAPGLVPFQVLSPLWSDGAEKRRYLALPPGTKIHVEESGDPGHFRFPMGTVLVKTFLIEGRFVETRLFVKFADDDWVGYSYEWNEAQTDAQVIEGVIEARERRIEKRGGGSQTWYFPSRRDCLKCHTEAAGFSLGPHVAQLDMEVDSGAGKRNQLDALEAMGLFDAPLPRNRRPLPTPTLVSSGSVEARARSYLHTNCALCHRPGGDMATFDLRYTTSLAAAEVCNVNGIKGGFDADARLLVPGRPEKSLISLRMHVLDSRRMPQIASSVVDAEGVAVVDAWIRGLGRCP